MTELGVCSECERNDDKTEKKLFKCEYCGNYYCNEHIKPKVSSTLYNSISTKNEHVEKFLEVEKRLGKKGHPDWEYSRTMFLKLEKEEQLETEGILRALDEMKEADEKRRGKEEKHIEKPAARLVKEEIPEYKEPKQSTRHHRSSAGAVVILVVLGILAYYLYYNPNLTQQFWYNLFSSNNSQNNVENNYQPTVETKTIPYVLDYPAKTIYLQSQYSGRINESNIGEPLLNLTQQGWKINYFDLPNLATTNQRIAVQINGNSQTQISTSTFTSTESAPWWTGISNVFFRIFNWQSLNCTDGTYYNQCSSNQPFYCFNGTLVKNSTTCGCPYDYKAKGDDCEKILRCSDGTIYGECSTSKPNYCLDGILINRSSICGCSINEVPQADTCVSQYEVGPKEIQLNYLSGSISYTVYKGLNDYLASLPRTMSYTQGTAPPTDRDFVMRNLNDEEQKKYLDPLVDKIKQITPNMDDQAKIAIMLVQTIPYDYNAFNTGIVNGKYPYEVLYTNTGVCSEKAQLLAYLLRGLGDGVAILRFNVENHDAIGIKCPAQYTYKNTGYCFVESTQLSAIGDSYENYVGVGQLHSDPEVIVVSDGAALQSIS